MDDFDEQFREDPDEAWERWQAIKASRRAQGRCWQCAKPVAECQCSNVKHNSPERP